MDKFRNRIVARGGLTIPAEADLTMEGTLIGAAYNPTLYVDTVNGDDDDSGTSWAKAFKTMQAALDVVEDHGTILFVGTVAEHCTAPLGVQGVSVIGASGGRNRHDDGARWKEAAVAGNAPLIIIREQGWEFHHILFVPQTGYSAIRAWRAEDATHPDSSHFIVKDCKFIGNVAIDAQGAGMGIEDWGGNHHYLVEDCEFNTLDHAIVAPAGSPGIAAPLRNIIRRNIFRGNANDISMDAHECLIEWNVFCNAYSSPAHVNTVNLAYLSDVSGANFVLHNIFADVVGNMKTGKGYVPSTGDVWRNWGTGAADAVIAVPTA